MSRAQEVAEELQGTALSIYEVSTEAERSDMAFCTELDSLVLQCDICGWWDCTDNMNLGERTACRQCEDEQNE